jgi:hypothetical protein
VIPNRNLQLTGFVFLLFLFAPAAAFGCSCGGESPPCEAFGSATAVFIGRVTGAKEQRRQKNEDGTTSTYQVGEIYFAVEQSFLGAKGSTAVIHSGTGGGDCGYWFIKGERYLVYAYGDSMESLGTGICTRTRPLSEAEEDLSFLKTLPRKGLGVRIYGTVQAALKDSKGEHWRKVMPLPGVTVKVVGERTFDAITNAEGKYELTGLPAGNYKVYAEVPDYYYRGDYWVREIKIADRGCSREDFLAQNDSRISGSVLKPDGTGLAKAMVELLPVELSASSVRMGGLDLDFTDEAGKFDFRQIPPGRYVLGINVTSSPDAENPYPLTFYPGTVDRENATVIEVELGSHLSGIDIQLNSALTEQTVRGFVTWPDGRLASGVDVYIEDVKRPGYCVNGCDQKTDERGQFELRGYTGYMSRVVATGEVVRRREKKEVFGVSDPFKLEAGIESLRIVLSKSGRPWDDENMSKETTPAKQDK